MVLRRCSRCNRPLDPPSRGRPPKFCSANCRQRAYERRLVIRACGHPTPAHAEDFEQAVVAILRKHGILPKSPVRVLIEADELPAGDEPDKR